MSWNGIIKMWNHVGGRTACGGKIKVKLNVIMLRISLFLFFELYFFHIPMSSFSRREKIVFDVEPYSAPIPSTTPLTRSTFKCSRWQQTSPDSSSIASIRKKANEEEEKVVVVIRRLLCARLCCDVKIQFSFKLGFRHHHISTTNLFNFSRSM